MGSDVTITQGEVLRTFRLNTRIKRAGFVAFLVGLLLMTASALYIHENVFMGRHFIEYFLRAVLHDGHAYKRFYIAAWSTYLAAIGLLFSYFYDWTIGPIVKWVMSDGNKNGYKRRKRIRHNRLQRKAARELDKVQEAALYKWRNFNSKIFGEIPLEKRIVLFGRPFSEYVRNYHPKVFHGLSRDERFYWAMIISSVRQSGTHSNEEIEIAKRRLPEALLQGK